MHQQNIRAPFDRIPIDTAGPLPLGDHGNRYLVMAMDNITKRPEGYASPTKRHRQWQIPW
jgi:hypothetical protein